MTASAEPFEILIDVIPGETRVAWLVDGRLLDLEMARTAAGCRVGDIYLGRVRRIVPALSGAFVDIGLARDAFLSLGGRGGRAAGPTEGAGVTVQVSSAAVAGKGPKVTRAIRLEGPRLVFFPGRDVAAGGHGDDGLARQLGAAAGAAAGAAIGTKGSFALRRPDTDHGAADHGAADMVGEDMSGEAGALAARWAEIDAARAKAAPPARIHRGPGPVERVLLDHGHEADRVIVNDAAAFAAVRRLWRRLLPGLEARLVRHTASGSLFESRGVEDQIAAALERRVPLPSGAALTIDATEALTAIDVDGGASAARGGAAATPVGVNLEAAQAIARELRLRRIAGLVVIDFLRMARHQDRRRVGEALRAALAPTQAPTRAPTLTNDPAGADIHGFTAAGLFEITRRRADAPLSALLTEACGACGGGRVKTVETVAFELLRAVLTAGGADPSRGLAVRAAVEVVAHLEGPGAAHLAAVEAAIGRGVVLFPDPGLARARFEVGPA